MISGTVQKGKSGVGISGYWYHLVLLAVGFSFDSVLYAVPCELWGKNIRSHVAVVCVKTVRCFGFCGITGRGTAESFWMR